MKQQLFKHPLQRLLYNHLGHTAQNIATSMKHIAKLSTLTIATSLLPIFPASAEVNHKVGFTNDPNQYTITVKESDVSYISGQTVIGNSAKAANSSNYIIAQSDLDSVLDISARQNFKQCVNILERYRVQIESSGNALGDLESFAICEHVLYVTDQGVYLLRTGRVSVADSSSVEASNYMSALKESIHKGYMIDFLDGLSAEKAQSYELSSSFRGLSEDVAYELYVNSISHAAYIYERLQKL